MLANLLANAVKFTDRGEVVVSIALEEPPSAGTGSVGSGGSGIESPQQSAMSLQSAASQPRKQQRLVHITIRDTGIGIDSQSMNKLFRSFQQAESSMSRAYGGTGLGLAISRQLAQLMGGNVWAQSQLGKGSTFHFTMLLETAGCQCVPSHAQAAAISNGAPLGAVNAAAAAAAFANAPISLGAAANLQSATADSSFGDPSPAAASVSRMGPLLSASGRPSSIGATSGATSGDTSGTTTGGSNSAYAMARSHSRAAPSSSTSESLGMSFVSGSRSGGRRSYESTTSAHAEVQAAPSAPLSSAGSALLDGAISSSLASVMNNLGCAVHAFLCHRMLVSVTKQACICALVCMPARHGLRTRVMPVHRCSLACKNHGKTRESWFRRACALVGFLEVNQSTHAVQGRKPGSSRIQSARRRR